MIIPKSDAAAKEQVKAGIDLGVPFYLFHGDLVLRIIPGWPWSLFFQGGFK